LINKISLSADSQSTCFIMSGIGRSETFAILESNLRQVMTDTRPKKRLMYKKLVQSTL